MIQKIIREYIPDTYKPKIDGNVLTYEILSGDLLPVCQELYFTKKLQLQTITATDERRENLGFRIFYVFGIPGENVFLAPYIVLKNTEEFPSVTKEIHEASGYERRISAFFGLRAIGHPNLRGMLLHENWPTDIFPLRKDFKWQERPPENKGKYKFQKVRGEGIHEIPVGPVHAGIIEPGHFRFSVAGEEIILLEPKLGYKHKGIEKLFEILSIEEKVRLSERVSGDTSFTHSMAFCQAMERLAEIEIPERAKYLRVIFSELERIANHLNDIGFIMLDTGYSFGGSNGARLREMIMQWNERLTDSRFLRGINAIGGVTKDINPETCTELLKDLEKIHNDFNEVIKISEDSSSVLNRLQNTGKLNCQLANDHGVIGVAGRAIGIAHDSRIEYPYAIYNKLKFDMALEKEGDVRARFYIRIKEIHSSMEILKQTLKNIPPNRQLQSDKKMTLKKSSFAVGIAEGWRGAIIYFIVTDSDGNITRVDLRDPSFINWTVLGYAGKGNVVPDFPLINKSFNLSYSGNDL